MPFIAIWMELKTLILSEVSQKEKDKYHMNITYMQNLKYGTHEPIYRIERDSYITNRLVVAKGEEKGEGWIGSLGLVDANYYIQNE